MLACASCATPCSPTTWLRLLGVALRDRPGAFAALLARVAELRARTGRPHWLVVDEAHHVEALFWNGSGVPRRFRPIPPNSERRLRASNLQAFLDLAEGVDADTSMHHLRAHDDSEWIRAAIEDPELADEVRAAERADASADESRARIRAAIDRRYTLPS